jgi:cytochrome P450
VHRSAADPHPGDLPLQMLAASADPTEKYAELARLGVHLHGGTWVVCGHEDVAAALASPAMSVAPVATETGDARRLQARMARFSDAPYHARRRDLVQEMLPSAPGLKDAAAERTRAVLPTCGPRFDLMSIARTVPVATLAAAMGVPADRVAGITTQIGRLCDALAPSHEAAVAERPDGDSAVRELAKALTAVLTTRPRTEEALAAAVGVLFQARDATAALVGATVLLEDQDFAGGDPEPQIGRALREQAPVQSTRRVALEDTRLGSGHVPAGASLWISLAAAERGGPVAPATFGSGPHACPGSAHAIALTRGIVAAVYAAGYRLLRDQTVEFEPRPNLRMPSKVLVARV